MPEGSHYVHGHMRRNPGPRRAKKTSGWVIAAGVAAALWMWAHGSSSSASTTTPAPTVSVSASSTAAR